MCTVSVVLVAVTRCLLFVGDGISIQHPRHSPAFPADRKATFLLNLSHYHRSSHMCQSRPLTKRWRTLGSQTHHYQLSSKPVLWRVSC